MARLFASGSSQYLTMASAVASAAPLTLACWFRPSNVAGATSKTLVAIDDGTSNNFFLLRSVGSTGTVSAVTNDGGGAVSSTTAAAQSDGTYGHCAAVFASATSRVAYLNGTAASAETTSSTPSGISTTNVGRIAGIQFADGDIGEVAIWSAALSAADIARLAAGALPRLVQPSSLVAYWRVLGVASPEPEYFGGTGLTLGNAPGQSTADPPMVLPSAMAVF